MKASKIMRRSGAVQEACVVGFLNKKFIKVEGFKPLELTEDNVKDIFSQCGNIGKDGKPVFNKEALKQNWGNLRYLLGQLDLVHISAKEHKSDSPYWKECKLDGSFCRRYDGKVWTNSALLVFLLLKMGEKFDFCTFDMLDSKIVYLKKAVTSNKKKELKPVYSPKDPKFTAWLETAEGLLFQAEAVEETVGSNKAISLYDKAAAAGSAQAQFQVGCFYAFGFEEIEKDSQAALNWFQLAAKQGHGDAQRFCDLMFKKTLLGSKIVDLAPELSKLLDGDTSSRDMDLILELYVLLPYELRDKFNRKLDEDMDKALSAFR